MGALPRSASSSDMRHPLATVIVTEPPPNEAENNLLEFERVMQEAGSFKLGHRASSARTLFEPAAVAVSSSLSGGHSGKHSHPDFNDHLPSSSLASVDSTDNQSFNIPPQFGEVRVWQRLSHPHPLPLLGVLSDEHVSLVSPFIDNESLPVYLSENQNADRARLVSTETFWVSA